MNTKLKLAGLAAATLLAAHVQAADAPQPPQHPQRPTEPLTLAQVQERNPAITNEIFSKADTDHNGLLSMDEMRAAMQAGVIRRPEGVGGPPNGAGGPPAGVGGGRPGGAGGPPAGVGGGRPGGVGGPPGGLRGRGG